MQLAEELEILNQFDKISFKKSFGNNKVYVASIPAIYSQLKHRGYSRPKSKVKAAIPRLVRYGWIEKVGARQTLEGPQKTYQLYTVSSLGREVLKQHNLGRR